MTRWASGGQERSVPGIGQSRVRSTALGYALLTPSLFGVVTFLLLPRLGRRLAQPAPLGPTGPNSVCRTGQLAVSVLTEPSFATSLVVTALFIVIVVPVQSVLGLMAAAMLARGLPGSGFFRTRTVTSDAVA